MAYGELKSLYYKDNDIYAQEYLNRFHSEEAIKIDFHIGNNQAFFLQNAEVWQLAFKIIKLNRSIEALCSSLPGVALEQYQKKCLIDEIVLTNRIEGVHSSRKEIGEALGILENQSSEKKGTKSRYLGLVNAYYKLIGTEKVILKDCQDIRALYDEIFLQEVTHEDPGNGPDGVMFRKNSVSVYSETGKEIHRGVMPESEIISSLQRALKFLNDDSIEELFRVCIFHYFLEYIHPFYDGNGRLGRFILSYGISQYLCPLISFKISETIREQLDKYYQAFKTCNDSRNLGDLTPFLIMQLTMLCSSMNDLKISLEEKKITWQKYENIVRDDYGDDHVLGKLYSLLIQAALFSENGISMQELIVNMESSAYIIKREMEKIPGELINIKKKGNTRYYSINMDALNQRMLNESLRTLQNSTTKSE